MELVISSFFNKPLHEHLGPTPIIIIPILFEVHNTLPILVKFFQKNYTIFY